MNVKLFILFSILTILIGLVIFFYGFRMLNPKHKPEERKEDNRVKVNIRPPVRKVEQFSPYYTAAVAEIEVLNSGHDATPIYINQMVDIINSPEVKEADIVVFSEAVLNRAFGYVYAPKSIVFCDDSNAHYAFRNISCAARKAKKYIVLNIYTRMKCEDDDQDFCVDKKKNTNIYNMMFVFDRRGANIAKYRKYNPYTEPVQAPAEAEIVTFKTDFNVTFGVMVCFDLMLHEPGNVLVQRGIRNFVFSTMWHNELPYGVSVQYQQSWAYGHNVNLLAANANWQAVNTSGSGIYAGRLGAQKVFFSEIPTSKVLVARLPINLPSEDETRFVKPDEEIQEFPKNDERVTQTEDFKPVFDGRIKQDNMDLEKIRFLDFTTSTNFSGAICMGDFCCNYNIEISKNTGPNVDNGPSYSYGIALFNDFYQFGPPKYVRTKQIICCLIACAELDDQHSCGKRFAGEINYPYSIDKVNLNAIVQMDRESNILPTTLTHDVYPLNVGSFAFKNSKLKYEERYAASMELKTPRSDLLTFGFISRDYKKDHSLFAELIALQKKQAEQRNLQNTQTNRTHPENY